jgi:hypothetical protein
LKLSEHEKFEESTFTEDLSVLSLLPFDVTQCNLLYINSYRRHIIGDPILKISCNEYVSEFILPVLSAGQKYFLTSDFITYRFHVGPSYYLVQRTEVGWSYEKTRESSTVKNFPIVKPL